MPLRKPNADLTVGVLRVTREQAREFGVMQVDRDYCITGFQEKPEQPMTIPGDDGNCLASMGIYVFKARVLFEQLCFDANVGDSSHDFGRDIIPRMLQDNLRVSAFPFLDENRKSQAYWRDVGALDAYYEANMDLVAVDPLLNLYDNRWPIRSYQQPDPPPKFVFGSQGQEDRCGRALDSLVCPGCIVSGGLVQRSILGANVRVNSYAMVEDSVLFEGVDVGRRAAVRRAIVEKDVRIPSGVEIGYDLPRDRELGLVVTPSGIVVVAKGDRLEHFPVTR